MASNISIEGDVAVRRALLRLAAKFPEAVGDILYEEGEEIMTRSKEEFVPVDLSTLKNSGLTHPAEIRGKTVTVELTFGGAASEYAIVQHERLDYRHTVGGPKYLERPLKEATAGMAGRIAAGLSARGMA